MQNAMSDTERRLSRRNVLKATGGVVGASVVGGAGLAAFTGSGVAVSAFSVKGDDSTFELNDGQVSAVVLDANGTITWDGLDHDATGATVTLDAKNNDGEWKQAAETELDLATKQRKDGSAPFSFAPVDLTTLSGLGDDYFSQDADGGTKDRTVDLRITVVVDTKGEDYTVESSKTASMNVSVLNEPKSAGGDATASTYDAYAGEIFDKNDDPTGEETYLYIKYGDDRIIMQMDLRNYEPNISDGAPLNAGIGVDANEDNVGEWQFGWLPEIDGPTFAVKDGDTSGWSEWQDAANKAVVTDTGYENGIVTFELDRATLGIGDGETFRTGYLATAGGEEEYVAVSAEPGKFWSTANNWTSSEYWLQARSE